MKALPLTAAFVLAIASPVLACDEESVVVPRTFVHGAGQQQAVALAAFAPQGAAAAADDRSNTNITIVDDSDGRRIEIRIHNDEIEAEVDGKDVPAERIVRDDEGIAILDENGEEIYRSNLTVLENGFGHLMFDPDMDHAFGNAYGWLGFDANMETPKVMLGVHMDPAGPAFEKQLGLDPDAATLITGVYEGLPASAAGVEEYDIIVSIEGAEKANPDSVREVLKSKEAGDVVNIEVLRAGERKKLAITLEAYDTARMHAAVLLGSAAGGFGAATAGAPYPYRLWTGGKGQQALVIDPNLFQHQGQAPIVALRDRMSAFSLNEEELQAQVEELRARLDKMNEEIQQMIEDALEKNERTLRDNES